NSILAETEKPVTADTSTIARAAETVSSILPSQPQSSDPLSFGAFAQSATGEQGFITVSNKVFVLKIAKQGGRIYSVILKDFKTHDGKPLILFDGDSTVFGLKFFTVDNKAVQTNELFFTALDERTTYDVSDAPVTIALRSFAGEDKYIEYLYTIEPDDYMIDFRAKFHDLKDIVAANQSSITFDWKMYLPQQEKGRQNEDNYTSIKYKYHQAEVDGFRERSTKEIETADISNRLKWVAFKDQFFSSVIISNDYFLNGTVTSTRLLLSDKYLRHFSAEAGVPYSAGEDTEMSMQIYFGPNHFSSLRKYDLDLEELVFLGRNIIRGINQYVIIPVFNFLDNSISNYGIIILILTILIKIVLFPLTFKSYQSQAKMKVLKPMVDEIGKKFPKAEDAMKKQQATMALYKKAGVNPLGGCLPMLLQMPILFAMFRFFPASIELRQEAFLWATDLSTYDSILELPFTIPMYGDHVSLFTILMTVSTILTMKFNSPTGGQDQMPGMKVMMYMMPVMFMLILNNFSSGLTYYYFLANIITYAQNMISKSFIDENKILKKLEENSQKPVKKSNWQKRLEDAAKKRGYNPSKK
ncbi:MAG: membrane protein insertase YidC, partial [Bacteroidales bacterium]|nr:membrane protein insertase YidC [Bacteroidales bacterium]